MARVYVRLIHANPHGPLFGGCNVLGLQAAVQFQTHSPFGCEFQTHSPFGCGNGRSSGHDGSNGDGAGLGRVSGLGSVAGLTSGSTVGVSGMGELIASGSN